ncbi:pregnancy-specific glycoprotein 22-like [Diretmus argenteus]
MANASGHRLWFKKHHHNGSTNVFTLKRETVTIQQALINRTEFFISNGTFKIRNVERADSGQYTAEVFEPNGFLLGINTVHLDVQAFFPATETPCTVTQGSSSCSVSLGGSVYIQVMANASGHRLWFKKHHHNGSTNVFTLKRETVTIQQALINRTEFFISNGTFKIRNVERADSGQYTAEVFEPNGFLLGINTVHLDVQAFFPATETPCTATQGSSSCSVSLGGSVYIQVMANASGHRLWFKKHHHNGSTNVFTLKRETVTIQQALINRTEFFISNGTFKIRNVERADSGQYTAEVFEPNGFLLGINTVHLDVQVMANASGHRLWFKKHHHNGSTNVFTLKRETVTIQQALINRTEFFISNGTFKIRNVERADSGQYTAEVFEPNGPVTALQLRECERRFVQI